MWQRYSRESERSVRIRRAGNVPEIALATRCCACTAHGGGGGGGEGEGGRGCTINVNIEWCGKWAANWMQFKHLNLDRERDKRVSLLQLCFFGGHPATARWWRQVRGRPRCICNMCVQTPSASSALSPPPSSLAASVNDHELRQSRSLCRSCSHDLMHYA